MFETSDLKKIIGKILTENYILGVVGYNVVKSSSLWSIYPGQIILDVRCVAEVVQIQGFRVVQFNPDYPHTVDTYNNRLIMYNIRLSDIGYIFLACHENFHIRNE